ncbi:hypothetical protein [Klebsiella pneumoniae]|uniref:hypothetical protein n=1 Tax=Klebsiella pneumoniae TaxID=573 RepID=UPI0013301447|nr:hypothetical protein [Klebsiella pneumoniae]
MGKNDVNQIAYNVRVVHAGCGVNALSDLRFGFVVLIRRGSVASGNECETEM